MQNDGELTPELALLVGPVAQGEPRSACRKSKPWSEKKTLKILYLYALRSGGWANQRLGLSQVSKIKQLLAMMSQPDMQKLIGKAQAIRGGSTPAQQPASPVGEVAAKPSANLLEILHARKLRDRVAQQVLRLEEQSCALSWSLGMAEFEPLYCDSQQQPMRNPLNADEVRSHYVDLLVAMDHLLTQLGDSPSEP